MFRNFVCEGTALYSYLHVGSHPLCVCACVRACVRVYVCVHVCVRACVRARMVCMCDREMDVTVLVIIFHEKNRCL